MVKTLKIKTLRSTESWWIFNNWRVLKTLRTYFLGEAFLTISNIANMMFLPSVFPFLSSRQNCSYEHTCQYPTVPARNCLSHYYCGSVFLFPFLSDLIIPLWLYFTPFPFKPLNQLDEREVFTGSCSCSGLYKVKALSLQRLIMTWHRQTHNIVCLKGDQKVSVHPMIRVQKTHAKYFKQFQSLTMIT
jgi:hypothetical protein